MWPTARYGGRDENDHDRDQDGLRGAAAGDRGRGRAPAIGRGRIVWRPGEPVRAAVALSLPRASRGRGGGGLAIAVLIGAVAGSWTPVASTVTGLVAGTAPFVCQAAELPPPRELMLIMALLAATAVPAGLAGAAQCAVLTGNPDRGGGHLADLIPSKEMVWRW